MVGDDAAVAMIAALRRGLPVLLPTDTVYGLAANASSEDDAAGLYRLKGRRPEQPSALLAADVDTLMRSIPELDSRSEAIARVLLPGPYTLVLPNPAGRYPWLTGARSDTIGVRVAELRPPAAAVVAALGCVLATSANEPGGPNPVTLDDVPARIRAGVGAELDAGPLPGTPSAVIDLTGARPVVIRDGAAPAADAIERVRHLLAG
jgi:L-threonylcarbamoyladenylate synthase